MKFKIQNFEYETYLNIEELSPYQNRGHPILGELR